MYNVIAVDFDGILSDEKYNPMEANIRQVNDLFNTKDNFIVIHTSRNYKQYVRLVTWLDNNNVLYNAICMNKMKADIYIDDRNGTL